MTCTPSQFVKQIRGFTLVELLVVVGLIALLIALLVPALNKARRQANCAFCLSNMRSMQIAQWNYAVDNHGFLVQAGMAHGGTGGDETLTWFSTLSKYYGGHLSTRCPSDVSNYWPEGIPVAAGSPPQYRRTSYGINDFLDQNLCPWGPNFVVPCLPDQLYIRMDRIRHPSVTIQFVEITYYNDFGFAGSDHVHVENWNGPNKPADASRNVQINAHGGQPKTWDAISNYGFLDGHAETLHFRDVYQSVFINKFDPYIAK